jgi:zinc protease
MGSTHLNIASLPGPETIARRVFPNGGIGLAWENFSSPSVVVHGWLWAGSVDEAPSQAGLAGLAASMLTRGTERRTFAQISEETESVGAALGFRSSGHTTSFTAKCLVEDLPMILDVLTDCLYRPIFPPEYVEKRRGEILTAIEQREHDTRVMASLYLHELMYGQEHPYGRSSLGYRETIQDLARGQVEAFYREHYGPRNMGVSIVGAISAADGLDLLEEALGKWQGASHVQPPLPAIEPLTKTVEKRATIPGKTQSNIALGWLGLRRQDPDFLKAYLANCILGQFGMMGRVGDYVRDQQGLAYYAYTSLDAGVGPGPWAAIAGVAPQNVDRAVEAILEQIRRLQREPAGAEELADSKAYIVDSLPLRLEGKEGVAAQIAHMELYGLGLDYLQRFPALIEALTAEDVMAVARAYMDPDAYVLSIAGPPEAEED